MAMIEFERASSRGIYRSEKNGKPRGFVGFREETHAEASLRAHRQLQSDFDSSERTKAAAKNALFDAVFIGEHDRQGKISGYRLPVRDLVGVVEYRRGLETLMTVMENNDMHTANRMAGGDARVDHDIKKRQAADRRFLNTVLQGGLVSTQADIERFYTLRNSQSYRLAAETAYGHVVKECAASDVAYSGQLKDDQRRRGLVQIGAREIPIYQVRQAPKFVARALGK